MDTILTPGTVAPDPTTATEIDSGDSPIMDSELLYRLTIISAVLLIILYAVAGHCIEKFKCLFIHESTVGVLSGILVQYLLVRHEVIEFNSQSFFFFLLPPIVFASAYTLQKKNFIKNISYIMGLGILGTIVAMIVVSCILLWGNEYFKDPETGETWIHPAECLLLASVLASTDTVAVLTLITADKYQFLNSILFGEGVVNDAVTILLYQAVEKQIQESREEQATDARIHGRPAPQEVHIGMSEVGQMVTEFLQLSFFSIAMGAMVGLTCSYLLKKLNLNYDPVKEVSMMMMFAYLSYLLAEQSSLSGIISMFSTGLFMAHYAYWNIGRKARIGTELAVNSIAGLSQSFLYIYMGLSAFSIEPEHVNFDFVKVTLASIFICRIFSVGVPILIIYLSTGLKPTALKWNEWVFVYFGGLIRGAIAFGLSLKMPTENHKVLKTTTQICALITIVGIGAPIQLIAKCFSIKPDKEIAAEKKKAAAAAMAAEAAPTGGDDDFLKIPEATENQEAASSAGSVTPSGVSDLNFVRAGCQNEDDAVDLINHSFQELIEEDTYPWLIEKFIEFDKHVMMPIFKRKTNLKKKKTNAE